MESINQVTIPLYCLDDVGAVMPNPAFHRPWDRLHSRCIEYPFAASRLGAARRVLDIGTAQADDLWRSWLEQLPFEVHATDYDPPAHPLARVKFWQADVRHLPLPDAFFDTVLAVSIIEHIGLASPQVRGERVPHLDPEGDLAAVRELARVLRPGGKLVMTFPFGMRDALILSAQARSYSLRSLRKFDTALRLSHYEYYEYQHRAEARIYRERSGVAMSARRRLLLLSRSLIARALRPSSGDHRSARSTQPAALPGIVTWRRVPPERSQALNREHVEGVLCGVWVKP